MGGLEWNTGLEWTMHWNNIQQFSMAGAKASSLIIPGWSGKEKSGTRSPPPSH